jgi:hypothetical protein
LFPHNSKSWLLKNHFLKHVEKEPTFIYLKVWNFH